MILFILSFIAGVLTVLSPCILPLLPVIVGGSLSGGSEKRNPYAIIISLIISVTLFTLLLKVSSAFIMVPADFWTYLSGGVIFLVGVSFLFPALWEKIPLMNKFSKNSNKLLTTGYKKKSLWGDIIIGSALGPVFSSCSPTYFVILATVLPQSFSKGLIDLLSYSIGLGLMLLLISYLGDKIITKLGVASDPKGLIKKTMGIIFILVGLFIASGVDKLAEAKLYETGFDITKIETLLLEKVSPGDNALKPSGVVEQTSSSTDLSTKTSTLSLAAKALIYPKYKEIVDPSGFINTNDQPIKIGDYVGKKVILLDIMTYSCINCQRTFPYVTSWYAKYKDQGLIVIGIHTPEFAFEKVKSNVETAMKKFGITFPVVMDNDYGTWNAYGNQYWPRKYLIDIDGYVVYDHIGEGDYDKIEGQIQKALKERNDRLGINAPISSGVSDPKNAIVFDESKIASPETYFGAARNMYLGNGVTSKTGVQNLTTPSNISPNTLYLDGAWNFKDEYAETNTGASITYKYSSKNVYFVASGNTSATVKITLDGQPIGTQAGDDVNTDGTAVITGNRLYNLVKGSDYGTHTLKIEVQKGTLDAFTFTFG